MTVTIYWGGPGWPPSPSGDVVGLRTVVSVCCLTTYICHNILRWTWLATLTFWGCCRIKNSGVCLFLTTYDCHNILRWTWLATLPCGDVVGLRTVVSVIRLTTYDCHNILRWTWLATLTFWGCCRIKNSGVCLSLNNNMSQYIEVDLAGHPTLWGCCRIKNSGVCNPFNNIWLSQYIEVDLAGHPHLLGMLSD